MKTYSQIVVHDGNKSLIDILDISVLSTFTGNPIHVHAEGLRGTGKTTIMRAYKSILPFIERIKGCEFNCDPRAPHCPEHKNLNMEEINKIGVEKIRMPFVEISASAKKGTVVGSIDLEKLTSKDDPRAALLLGTIPKANRGILFIDEINRIADISPEIADILLDVMGTKPGRIQIEEVGLPTIEIPVNVTVWAASNPDEEPGPLEDVRKQLSDRFDFVVYVDKPHGAEVVKSILEGEIKDNGLSEILKKNLYIDSRKRIEKFQVSEEIKDALALCYVNFNLESIRGLESVINGLKMLSALYDRDVNPKDVTFLARYALKHRTSEKNVFEIIKFIENTLTMNRVKRDEAEVAYFQKNKAEESEKINKKIAGNNKRIIFDRFKFLRWPFLSKKYKTMGSNHNPVGVEIKAPPQKAKNIDEIGEDEIIKTEEELK